MRSDFCKFVDFSRITSSKRFFSASDFGIHLVVKPAEDLDRIDFTSTMIPVSVTDSEDLEGEMKVANEFVLLEYKDCFYGPLRLKRDNRGKNYVTFSGTVNKGSCPPSGSRPTRSRRFASTSGGRAPASPARGRALREDGLHGCGFGRRLE